VAIVVVVLITGVATVLVVIIVLGIASMATL
jgi:hypothetical protein